MRIYSCHFIASATDNFLIKRRVSFDHVADNKEKTLENEMWNEPSKERLDKIPRLYETEKIPIEEKLIYLHFFIGSCDWYVAEFDGDDTFWGYAILNGDLQNAEWGYFSFSELRDVKVKGGVEVDCELEEIWRMRMFCEIEMRSD